MWQFEVSLLAVDELELRVKVETSCDFCHAVWLTPKLTVRTPRCFALRARCVAHPELHAVWLCVAGCVWLCVALCMCVCVCVCPCVCRPATSTAPSGRVTAGTTTLTRLYAPSTELFAASPRHCLRSRPRMSRHPLAWRSPRSARAASLPKSTCAWRRGRCALPSHSQRRPYLLCRCVQVPARDVPSATS